MDLIVLGVDGVPQDYIEEAIEKYDLEGWRELVNTSVFSELPSTVPAVTIPAWISMFSGYNPGKIDAYHLSPADFEEWEFGVYSSNFEGLQFWDRADVTASLHNVPGTSPIYEIDGYVRGGFPHFKEFEFYPDSLEDEMSDLDLEKESSYRKKTAKSAVKNEFKNYQLEEEIMNRMMEKDTDVFVSVIKMTDDVGHFANNKDQILQSYREADRAVQKTLRKAEEENANLLVVSDHGFKRYDTNFNVTRFLEKNNWLEKVEGSEESIIYDLFEPLLKTPLRKYLKALHNYYSDFTGERLDGKDHDLFSSIKKSSKIIPIHKGLGRDCLLKVHTEDLPHGHVTQEEKEEILRELEKKLLEVEYRGQKVVQEVWKGEELYSGDGFKPDLAFRTHEDFAVETKTMSKMFNSTKSFSHDTNGIFYAKGPDINEDADIDMDIYGVAPLIYTLLGEEMPDDLEGEIPEELVPNLEVKQKATEIDDISF